MNIPPQLRKRINFQGEFSELLTDVSKSYELGSFVNFEFIETGFEDVNLKLVTTKGNYFVKIFADTRDDAECLRLINVIKSAIDKGIPHPEFLKRDVGYIFRNQYEQFNIRLAVFEWIEGKTYYELKRNPSTSELKEIIKIAALSNSIDYKPAPLYDSWALVNFKKEFRKAKKFLQESEVLMFEALQNELDKVDINKLPHVLVHGDLISTNIIKSKDKIYFVDYSVANYYPRIVELAVLMADVMFDPTGKVSVGKYYKLLVDEYQKYEKLTKEELKTLPLFVKLAHAMHIIRGTRFLHEEGEDKETLHWVALGNKGLKLSIKAFLN